MPNDVPDWTGLNQVNLVGGVSGDPLGDVGAPSLSPDQGQETITTGGGLNATGPTVLASFKAAVGSVIARVGALGAITKGSTTSVTPPFGQATSAGNFALACVGPAASATASTSPGWVKVVERFDVSAGGIAIWAKLNIGANEVAPTFTASAGPAPLVAQVAEFSGVATVGATDKTASIDSFGNPQVVQMAAADAAFGDLVVMASFFGLTNPATATFSEAFNNGASAVHMGDTGTTPSLFPASYSYAIVPLATVAQPVGVGTWDYDVVKFHAPVTGTVAQIVLPAVAGKAYRLAHIMALERATTAVGVAEEFQVLDGATPIWQTILACQAAINAIAQIQLTGLAIKGTAGNSMTIQFAACAASEQQRISVGAYLR